MKAEAYCFCFRGARPLPPCQGARPLLCPCQQGIATPPPRPAAAAATPMPGTDGPEPMVPSGVAPPAVASKVCLHLSCACAGACATQHWGGCGRRGPPQLPPLRCRCCRRRRCCPAPSLGSPGLSTARSLVPRRRAATRPTAACGSGPGASGRRRSAIPPWAPAGGLRWVEASCLPGLLGRLLGLLCLPAACRQQRRWPVAPPIGPSPPERPPSSLHLPALSARLQVAWHV